MGREIYRKLVARPLGFSILFFCLQESVFLVFLRGEMRFCRFAIIKFSVVSRFNGLLTCDFGHVRA